MRKSLRTDIWTGRWMPDGPLLDKLNLSELKTGVEIDQ